MSIEMIAAVIVAGVAVGCLSAMFGVGGGVLMVPFLVLVLDETQHLAEGTSLLVIVPTAVVGVLAHRRSGFVSFHHALLLAAGGIGGAWLGAVLALRLSAETLQVAFGVFMGLIGLRTILNGIKQMKAERPTATSSEEETRTKESPPTAIGAEAERF